MMYSQDPNATVGFLPQGTQANFGAYDSENITPTYCHPQNTHSRGQLETDMQPAFNMSSRLQGQNFTQKAQLLQRHGYMDVGL